MNTTQSIIKFNTDRNLTHFNGACEIAMLEEELHELKIAVSSNNKHEIVDALNDLRVIATGAVWKFGQDPELSLKQTCKEINSRTGSIDSTGKFQKDNSPTYTANYALSKR